MPPPAASERLQHALARIDALNRQDPTRELVEGAAVPKELLYSQRVTDWVLRLQPDASEELRIAARGQHVCRWTIPRERYERNRRGYLRWRETLKTFHAQTVTRLMVEAGYPAAAIERVGLIMSKRRLADDADTQTLEDALCLVFLETQLADLRKKEPEEKMAEILRKTWQKMSPHGRAAARRLPLGEAERRLLDKTLAASP